ncbi:hypothetical protein IAR55_000794 [Kwoniella newhampshirensis]|uniref:AMP-activated protein kinase glycogen-binding domain-containing protein n=1 Tax=Kwoniella newhampshirensis TaxID=1651941 RepID=A0AAW0Z432_9TREE
MSTDHHLATFTWGPGAQTVYVAGGFNNWSADATPLHKQPDGSFAAEIPLPWGEKQAFKYVVDGEWKVREDEAKEWDAAGNMNNVYTAPSAAVAAHSTSSSPTTSKSADGPTTKEESTHTSTVPPTTVPDTPAPAPAESKTEPSTLIASSAPGTASNPNPLLSLGGPISFGEAKPKAITSTTRTSPTTTTSTLPPTTSAPTAPAPASTSAVGGNEQQAAAASAATVALPAAAAHQANPEATKPLSEESIAVQRAKVAAHSNVGEAPTSDEAPGLAEKAAEYGSAAMAALGAAVGGAAAVVERATGVDLTHSSPLSVEQAKAQGIDVKSLEKVDGATDTTSAVAPPSAAVLDTFDEKIQELKTDSSKDTTGVASVPLPNGEPPKTSLPGPDTINLDGKKADEKREHDIPAQDETKDNHTHVPQPVFTTISPKDPKKDRTLASTDVSSDTAGTKPISDSPAIDLKAEKAKAEANPVGNATVPAADEKRISPDTPANNISKSAPTASASAPTPVPVSEVPPATPAKTAPPVPASNGVVAAATPSSATSTPASTPAKSTHTRDTTASSDVKKRKSGIFGKIKHAFSPKDKEKSK